MNILMKRYKYIIISLLLILFITNLDLIIKSTKYACNIFFNKVFISVFPFVLLSDILIYYDYHIFLSKTIGKYLSKLFNIDSNTTIVFILSMLTSNPTNAIIIKDMLDKNIIDENTANKILPYTFFPSIAYVIGTIGIGSFNSFKIGLFIWLIILFNNIFIGIFQRKQIGKSNTIYNQNKEENIFNILKNSILKGINTSFIILGNLIIFIIITNLFIKYIKLDSILISMLSSILEATNGINQISILNISNCYKIILIVFSLLFSSISILFQAFSILSDYNINLKRLLIIKLVFSLLISITIIIILLLI